MMVLLLRQLGFCSIVAAQSLSRLLSPRFGYFSSFSKKPSSERGRFGDRFGGFCCCEETPVLSRQLLLHPDQAQLAASRPSDLARVTAVCRLFTRSLRYTCLICSLTVLGVTTSS